MFDKEFYPTPEQVAGMDPEMPLIQKTFFFFYGSLSVIQAIEKRGIEKCLRAGMSQPKAFDIAEALIKEEFGEDFTDYDLDLVVEDYEKTSKQDIDKAYEDDIEYYIRANGLDEKSLEEHDGSGNAQGWTAFLV